MGAAQNTYSAFDPSADALPTSSYNAPADPEASATKAQTAYSAPEQLKEPVVRSIELYGLPMSRVLCAPLF